MAHTDQVEEGGQRAEELERKWQHDKAELLRQREREQKREQHLASARELERNKEEERKLKALEQSFMAMFEEALAGAAVCVTVRE